MAKSVLERVVGFDQVATVYVETAETGFYETIVKRELRCRLAHITVNSAAGGNERSELAQRRRLIWPFAYVMPEHAQVEIDGERWQAEPGTIAAIQGPTALLSYRAADVVKQS